MKTFAWLCALLTVSSCVIETIEQDPPDSRSDVWSECRSDGQYQCWRDWTNDRSRTDCTKVRVICRGNPGQECSANDDCTMGTFCSGDHVCNPSTQCTEDWQCRSGYRCDDRNTCVPNGDNRCNSDGDCASNQHCDLRTSVCTDKGTELPPSCAGVITCATSLPTCAVNAVPLILDGCYTGQCQLISQCDQPPACDAIRSEPACVGRTDCEAIYNGIDCQRIDGTGCQPGEPSCICARFLFASCEDASP
jgi:hypothetical protein